MSELGDMIKSLDSIKTKIKELGKDCVLRENDEGITLKKGQVYNYTVLSYAEDSVYHALHFLRMFKRLKETDS